MAASAPFHPLMMLVPALMLPAVVVFVLVLHAVRPGIFQRPQRPNVVAQFIALRPRDRVIVVSVIAGFIALAYWSGHWNRVDQVDVLRRQFLIPDDVEVTEVRLSRGSSAEQPAIEASAVFTPAQFAAYAARLDEPGLWQPVLQSYSYVPIVSYSARALQWTFTPAPSFLGDGRFRLGSVPYDAAYRSRTNRVFCFALQGEIGGRWLKNPGERPTQYVAKACSEYGRQEPVNRRFLAVLDAPTRTLYMNVR